MCIGNYDKTFLILPNIRNGITKDHSSKFVLLLHLFICDAIFFICQHVCLSIAGIRTVAFVDSTRSGFPSIYHDEYILVEASSTSRPASNTGSLSLHYQLELINCHVMNIHILAVTHHTQPYTLQRKMNVSAACMLKLVNPSRQKINTSVENNPAHVDRELDDDLRKIVVESQDDVRLFPAYLLGSPEQQKASAL